MTNSRERQEARDRKLMKQKEDLKLSMEKKKEREMMKLWLENKKKETKKKYDLEIKAQQREHEQNLKALQHMRKQMDDIIKKIKAKNLPIKPRTGNLNHRDRSEFCWYWVSAQGK